MIFARPYKFLRNGGYTRSSNKKEECICLENTMQKTGLRRGLTTAQLKWIALVLMVLDHIHYFFEFTGAVPLLFSQLGRLSAGLFLFCLIEGFIHTHDRRRYFLRIYLVSVGMGAVQFCCPCCRVWTDCGKSGGCAGWPHWCCLSPGRFSCWW